MLWAPDLRFCDAAQADLDVADFPAVRDRPHGASVSADADGSQGIPVGRSGGVAMRSAIAIIMAILGTVLVLSGAAALWASALVKPVVTEQDAASRLGRAVDVAGRLPGPDRLITWGVVLLALSAVAAGAITFSATTTAGN
jgi:hypothetical protein